MVERYSFHHLYICPDCFEGSSFVMKIVELLSPEAVVADMKSTEKFAAVPSCIASANPTPATAKPTKNRPRRRWVVDIAFGGGSSNEVSGRVSMKPGTIPHEGSEIRQRLGLGGNSR